MRRNITLRNVPEDLYRLLKARADASGLSLSEYLLALLGATGERASAETVRARIARRPSVRVADSAANILRRQRGV